MEIEPESYLCTPSHDDAFLTPQIEYAGKSYKCSPTSTLMEGSCKCHSEDEVYRSQSTNITKPQTTTTNKAIMKPSKTKKPRPKIKIPKRALAEEDGSMLPPQKLPLEDEDPPSENSSNISENNSILVAEKEGEEAFISGSDGDGEEEEGDAIFNDGDFGWHNDPEEKPEAPWEDISEDEFFKMRPEWLKSFNEKTGYQSVVEDPNSECQILNIPKTPLESFRLFFDDVLMDGIVDNTNLYQRQTLEKKGHESRFQMVTKQDIWFYFGCLIYMGIIKLPNYKYHWKQDNFFGKSIISQVLPRERFERAKKYFHLNDNTKNDPKDRLFTLRPLLTRQSLLWKQLYAPRRELCIDEKMIPFRGRIKFKQYCPDKPTKYGFKVFVLCEGKTGYVVAADVYTGKKETVTKDLGGRTVKELIMGLENKGHCLYMDSFYTSAALFNELEKVQFGATGTVRKNRRDLPPEVKTLTLMPNQSRFFRQGNLVNMVWRDKRDVYLLTNVDFGAAFQVNRKYPQRDSNGVLMPKSKKPYMISRYNEYKGAVDLNNQYCSYYSYDHRVYKWWMRIFLGFMDISLFNAFVILRDLKNPFAMKGFLDFRIEICREIFYTKNKQPVLVVPKSPTNNTARFSMKHHCGKGKQRCCRVCSTAEKKKTTINVCLECNVNVCRGQCWMVYHTKTSIAKRHKEQNLL